jgi:two-component system cell cycle sensor histidine kinase/response regulator CckA
MANRPKTKKDLEKELKACRARLGRLEKQRLKAEDSASETLALFRSLTESSFAAIAIHEKGIILEVNDAFSSLTGYSRQEAVGRPILDFAAPEFRELVRKNSMSGYEKPYEVVGLDRKGRHRHVELLGRNIQYRGRPARVTALRDISHRKKAEAALKQSEQFLRIVFEAIQDGISVLDQDLRVIRVNGWMEKMYADQMPLVGKKCYEAYQRRSSPCVMCPSLLTLKTGTTQMDVVPYMKEGKKAGWIELSSYPLRDVEGKLIGVIESVKDITERKRAEEERARLQAQILHTQKLESLGVLAGGIAHDFNNLLMGVLGNASLAMLEVQEGLPAHEYICQIEKSGRHAAELTKQLLAYSGKGQFVTEPVHLSMLVEDMARLLKVSISKKVTIQSRLDDRMPCIDADPVQMRQVVMNLITNASEAMGDRGGVVHIRTGVVEATRSYLTGAYLAGDLAEGTYAYLEVSDSGCGMDEETKTKIFDPFFSTKFVGRGLGLAAVLGIVRAHRGAIKLYSEPGRGSTFRVLFPVVEAAPRKSSTPPPVRTSAARRRKTILVVDDEEDVLAVVKSMIESFGHSVLLARNGKECIRIFRKHSGNIALVILDTTMPVMDGEETFSELRKLDPDVRVILSSGFNEVEATRRFVGRGLAGFLQKPYEISELGAKLKKLL